MTNERLLVCKMDGCEATQLVPDRTVITDHGWSEPEPMSTRGQDHWELQAYCPGHSLKQG